MFEKPFNPESCGEEGEQSPRPHKRVRTGTPLVRCGGGLELKDEFADKSLFICSFETYKSSTHFPTAHTSYQPVDLSYVVRSISLSDLLTSSSEKLELRQVSNLVDEHLPDEGGCCVLGSKIVFVSGLKPNLGPDRHRDYFGFPEPFGPYGTTDAYAFDVHDSNQGIVKMPGALNGGKQKPLTFEFNGKLYVLSVKESYNFVPFEVFDPEQGIWSVLPKYPNHGSHHSYAIVGSRLFMSSQEHRQFFAKPDPSIFCFDLTAPNPEWRRLPSMCRGGPFPFTGRALVVDLPPPEHSNKKLLFSVKDNGFFKGRLVVHLMCLDENQGDVSKIMVMKLPAAALPRHPGDCHLFHLGGNNVCLVTTRTRDLVKERTGEIEHTVLGAAVPFHYEFDISKVDKDRKNCFTGQLQPPRVIKYHIRPDSILPPCTIGCLVL